MGCEMFMFHIVHTHSVPTAKKQATYIFPSTFYEAKLEDQSFYMKKMSKQEKVEK